MNTFYTSVVLMSCMALCALCVLIHENGRYNRRTKIDFYLTYVLLMLAELSEWGGVILNGAPEWTRVPHMVFKCMDYIFSPWVSLALVRQLTPSFKWEKIMRYLLIGNTIFQLISAFTGWTFYLDEHNVYHHGSIYAVYMVVFMIAFVYATYGFWIYGRMFKRRNRLSLYCIIIFTSVGVLLQEIVNTDIRTVNLSLTYMALLLFIHYTEFVQLRNDDHIKRQQEMLEIDDLTGLLNRYAYNNALSEQDHLAHVPGDTAVFGIDINGLKMVNDTYGHEAGDELICGAASCIQQVLGAYGRCFRTGGDEFVAIIQGAELRLADLRRQLHEATAEWHGKDGQSLDLSCGYAQAAEHPMLTLEQLVSLADRMMYQEKTAYYNSHNLERRKY